MQREDSAHDALVGAARAVRARAHAPYSGYRVGAAILTKSGATYVGCNVENATYGATICAERAAVCAMVAAGDGRVQVCAVYTEGDSPASPCGICRQVLAEFGDDDMIIVLVAGTPDGTEKRTSTTLGELLPLAFRTPTGLAAKT